MIVTFIVLLEALTVVRALFVLCHLVLPTALRGQGWCYLRSAEGIAQRVRASPGHTVTVGEPRFESR